MPKLLPNRVVAGLLAALSAASAIACGDALAPEGVAGTYVLQQVDGDHLPTVLFTTEFVRVRVLGDTVRLRADGTGLQINIWEIEALRADLAFDNPVRVETELRFATTGGRIEVALVCPPYAACTRPPQWVARLLADGLLVDFATGQRVPLLYARVTGP